MVNCIVLSIVFIESSERGHIEYFIFSKGQCHSKQKMKGLPLGKYLFGV